MVRYIKRVKDDVSEMVYVELACLSGDTKPAGGKIMTGSLCVEVDTGAEYRYDEASGMWLAKTPSGTAITGATVTLGSALTYTGSEQTQAVSSVVVGTTTLTANTDYVIVHNKATDAGTYTLQIVGKGSYYGVIEKEFTVGKASGGVSADPDTLSLEPGGDDGESAITVTGDGALSVTSSAEAVATAEIVVDEEDSSVSVLVHPLTAGSATITVTMAATANYTTGSDTISVTVAEPEDDSGEGD